MRDFSATGTGLRLPRVVVRAAVRGLVRPVFKPWVPNAVRRRWLDACSVLMPVSRGIEVRSVRLGEVPGVRVAHPSADANGVDAGRVVLYLHGGGYTTGSPRTHRALAGHLSQAVTAPVFLLDYRLAPEHPYPAALRDVLAAYRALHQAGYPPQRIVLAGDSAGGGLAVSTALALRDAGEPLPVALALLSPWLDLTLSGESITDNASREAMITSVWLAVAADQYRADHQVTTPGLSPLYADLAGLPPIDVQAAGDELLVSDADRFVERARAANVPVSYRRYAGLWHDFQLHAGLLREADTAVADLGHVLDRRWENRQDPRPMEKRPVPYTLDATGQDVHGEGARLREAGPASLVALPGDVVAWAVTSLSGLQELLTDPRVSKDPRQHWPRWINCEITPEWPLFAWVAVQNMLTAYGADHKRLRSLSAKAFTARNIAAQRPRIEQITADLLDALAAHPVGEVVDLREGFAFPLPIEVISQLFGVPDTMRAMLRKVVNGFFDTSLSAEEAKANHAQLYPLLNELIGIKRESPADDMTSALIAVRDDEDNSRLSETELADTLVLMLSAGHETTVNLLDQAIAALLTHPDQLELVRSGKNSWDDVIEETLRWQAPVPFFPLRFAVEDIDFHGSVIRKGDAIIGAYDAANRSPEANGEDADEFDITRRNKNYITFGYGMHYCLGAPLAKLEARIALPALFERFPDMSLAIPPTELRPVGSFVSNGHRALPVLR